MSQVITVEDLEKRFTYHPPKDNLQVTTYENIRVRARNFAEQLIANTPPSREQSLAITHLEEVVFWANAAVARNEEPV